MPMKSSPKGESTKLRIIRTAADLFHRQGLRATSPDEIVEASATGKGQFYHYFKNKEGLIHEVLLYHLQAIRDGTAPIRYDVESWVDLEAWFSAHIELQKQFHMARGCPFGTAANEITKDDDLLRQDLVAIFAAIEQKLAAFFAREKARGNLADDADDIGLARFCIATIQGAMLLGKVTRSSAAAEGVVAEALAHLRRHCVTPT
jgi:TetR/AcrR family transcriptional repressor of nem operon